MEAAQKWLRSGGDGVEEPVICHSSSTAPPYVTSSVRLSKTEPSASTTSLLRSFVALLLFARVQLTRDAMAETVVLIDER